MDLPHLSLACVKPRKPSKTGIVTTCCSLLLMAGSFLAATAADGKNDGKLDYNLEDYVYFPYTYQSLEMDPSINLFGNFTRDNDTSAMPRQDNLYNSIRLGWDYVFRKNTRRMQAASYFRGSLQYSFDENDYTTTMTSYDPLFRFRDVNSYSSFLAELSGNHDFKWYRTPKTFLNASLTHSLRRSGPYDQTREYMQTNSFNADSVSISYYGQVSSGPSVTYEPSLNLCVGRGRISDVTFPAVAVEALERLSQINALDKAIDKNDIERTAQLFEKLKNARLFDSRLKRIADIKEICSFLNADSLCRQITPETVMELLDLWEYAFTQERSAGRTLAFGFTTGGRIYYNSKKTAEYSDNRLGHAGDPFEYRKGHYKSLIPYRDTSYSVLDITDYKYGLIALLERHKPIRLSGQIYSKLAVSGGMMVNRSFGIRNSLFGDVAGDFSYTWFPNLRSTVRMMLSLDYSKNYWNSKALNRDDFRENVDFYDLSGGTSLHYYINPRLEYTINGSVGFDSRYDEYRKIHEHTFTYSISSSMNYEIF